MTGGPSSAPRGDRGADDGASGDAARLLGRLSERGWTIALAESLTGGLLTSTLVAVPGASATVAGGIVAYATPLKRSLLGVDGELLEKEGPVHPEVARQMAEGIRTALSVAGRVADVGVSTTGEAGPRSAGGRPVGTVHIGIATPTGTRVASAVLAGDRSAIRSATVRTALCEALAAL